MFQQMVRLTIAATIWRKYKQSILSLLALIGFWLVLNFIHQDYLAYAQLDPIANQSYIAYSYLAKWLLILGSGAGFVWFVNKPVVTQDNQSLNSVLKTKTPNTPAKQEPSTSDVDPFANIRKRKKLRSEADFVLEQADKSDRD